MIRGTSSLFRVTESISDRAPLFGTAHLAALPGLDWNDLETDLGHIRLNWAVPKVEFDWATHWQYIFTLAACT